MSSREDEYKLFVGKPADTELNWGTFTFPDTDQTRAVYMGDFILSHKISDGTESERIASRMRTLAAQYDRPYSTRNLLPYTAEQMQRLREGNPAFFLDLQTRAMNQLEVKMPQEASTDATSLPEPREQADAMTDTSVLPSSELQSA